MPCSNIPAIPEEEIAEGSGQGRADAEGARTLPRPVFTNVNESLLAITAYAIFIEYVNSSTEGTRVN